MELESQVAKIILGPEKNASTFVYLAAEKLPQDQTECFIVAEILENNPDLHSECENIALSLRSAVKRAFKKTADAETFETAVGLANEELGKLASLGQTHWIDKLNCIIGVKVKQYFNIATTGKVAAYLLRNRELTDLSCSAAKAHPLKTFENFASGKLKLNDLLILSTSQLFNYISIDKLKRLLIQEDFLKATAQTIEILKVSAEGGVAFGSIFALQSEAGSLPEAEVDLEEYINTAKPSKPSLFGRLVEFTASMFSPGRHSGIPKKNYANPRPTSLVAGAKLLTTGIKRIFFALVRGAGFAKENLKPHQIRQFSPQKKFFFFSICALLLAVSLQVSVALYLKTRRATQEKIVSAINEAQKNLSDADAASLYKDESAAREFYLRSLAVLDGIKNPSETQQTKINEIKTSAEGLRAKLEKTVEVEAQNLGALGASESLIKLPEILGTQSQGGQIVSFNKETGGVRDDSIKISIKIESAEVVSAENAAIYNGENLFVWRFNEGTVGQGFALNVPSKENALGPKFYSTSQRVYMLDKAKGQIISFAVLEDTVGRPQVSVTLKNDDGKNAVDFAIDGSIYILTGGDVKKYYAGAPENFGPLALLTPLNHPKKIYTKVGFANIYILDSGNKRILVLSKKGSQLLTLTSKDFTDLKDFEVDEKTRTIYVLNGASLLKVNLP